MVCNHTRRRNSVEPISLAKRCNLSYYPGLVLSILFQYVWVGHFMQFLLQIIVCAIHLIALAYSKVWIWNFPHYVTTLTRSTRSTKTKLTKYQKVLRPSKLYRHSFLGISKFCFQGNFKFSETSSGQNWSVPLRNFPNNQNRNFYAYRASWKLQGVSKKTLFKRLAPKVVSRAAS